MIVLTSNNAFPGISFPNHSTGQTPPQNYTYPGAVQPKSTLPTILSWINAFLGISFPNHSTGQTPPQSYVYPGAVQPLYNPILQHSVTITKLVIKGANNTISNVTDSFNLSKSTSKLISNFISATSKIMKLVSKSFTELITVIYQSQEQKVLLRAYSSLVTVASSFSKSSLKNIQAYIIITAILAVRSISKNVFAYISIIPSLTKQIFKTEAFSTFTLFSYQTVKQKLLTILSRATTSLSSQKTAEKMLAASTFITSLYSRTLSKIVNFNVQASLTLQKTKFQTVTFYTKAVKFVQYSIIKSFIFFVSSSLSFIREGIKPLLMTSAVQLKNRQVLILKAFISNITTAVFWIPSLSKTIGAEIIAVISAPRSIYKTIRFGIVISGMSSLSKGYSVFTFMVANANTKTAFGRLNTAIVSSTFFFTTFIIEGIRDVVAAIQKIPATIMASISQPNIFSSTINKIFNMGGISSANTQIDAKVDKIDTIDGKFKE